jgi:hypothetical protein
LAGELLRSDRKHVTRRFHSFTGRPPLGSAVDLASYPYRGDPRRANKLPFETVLVPAEPHELPAWFVPGARRGVWVVFVHGMAAGRGEALRALPVAAALGFPALVITYRNGPGGPASGDGLYHLGATEWQDLEAAVRYALGHGARQVVLYGFSMGGTIVADFLDRSTLAKSVGGVVLDAPVLDWDAAVRLAARHRRVPDLVTVLAKRVVTMRTGFHWEKARPEAFHVPVLLFHGEADDKVSIATSQSLADALGARVTFVRTPGAGHVQSWNFDPEGYERTLREWLVHTTASPPIDTTAR